MATSTSKPKTKAKAKAKAKDEPWNKENPRTASGKDSKPLTPAQKASAKRHAKAAGRPYPNLVDNMQAAKAAGGSKEKKK